jgi:replicative DNA helicase
MTSAATRPADRPDRPDLPPHNIEAEQELLGTIMVNNRIADAVRDIVRPEHFAEPVHGELFAVALRLIDRDLTANPITLRPWFDQHGTAAGFASDYLGKLAAVSVHGTDAKQLGADIFRQWQRRALMATTASAAVFARDDDGEADLVAAVRGFASDLDDIAQPAEQGTGFQPLARGMASALSTVEAAYQRVGDAKLAGLSSGFHAIDDLLGGFNRSDLTIVGGRPSMGKTALATNIAFNAAAAHRVDDAGATIDGAVVGFFSLEMSTEQLTLRIIGERSGVSSSRLRRGDLGSQEFDRVLMASQKLEALPLFIDDTGGLSLDQIRTRARRLKRTHGLGLLVIDYVQLVVGSERRRGANREQEVSEITRGLKALAKELDVPVLALSQLNRKLEDRTDKRPQLADLRESGSIEQDADTVLFVYRDDYYREREAKADAGVHEMHVPTNIAEIIVAKNRHGPTGTAALKFDGKLTRFHEGG